jgi:hypothetical protein
MTRNEDSFSGCAKANIVFASVNSLATSIHLWPTSVAKPLPQKSRARRYPYSILFHLEGDKTRNPRWVSVIPIENDPFTESFCILMVNIAGNARGCFAHRAVRAKRDVSHYLWIAEPRERILRIGRFKWTHKRSGSLQEVGHEDCFSERCVGGLKLTISGMVKKY